MNTLSIPMFQGFNKPEANFFRLPNEWTDITAHITSLAEMKVVEYVLRHTWGYSEYDIVKKITTDEFMHGGKGKDGNRIDSGTGLSNKSVVEGLSKAVTHGLLEVEIDDRDRARIKKYYKLKMKSSLEEGEHGSHDLHADVKNLHIGEKNVHSDYVKSSQRSEKDTIERYNNVMKYNKKDKNEVEYYAGLLAEKLGDRKSLTYYKIACQRFNPQKLMQKAAEIIADGGARNPGAVFADWLKQQSEHAQGGKNSATPPTSVLTRL
jgi:hypothetical protein